MRDWILIWDKILVLWVLKKGTLEIEVKSNKQQFYDILKSWLYEYDIRKRNRNVRDLKQREYVHIKLVLK